MLNNGFLAEQACQNSYCCLVLQVAVVYGFTRSEVIPQNVPLAQVPTQFGSWTMQQEGVVEQEVQDVLKADELLPAPMSALSSNELRTCLSPIFDRSGPGKRRIPRRTVSRAAAGFLRFPT